VQIGVDADAGAVGGLTAGVGVCGCVEIFVVPVFRVWIHCVRVCMCEWRNTKIVCSRENMVLHLQSKHVREDKLESNTQYMTCIQRHLRPCTCLHTHTHKENERESMNLVRSLPLIPSRTLALHLARVRAISLACSLPLSHTHAHTLLINTCATRTYQLQKCFEMLQWQARNWLHSHNNKPPFFAFTYILRTHTHLRLPRHHRPLACLHICLPSSVVILASLLQHLAGKIESDAIARSKYQNHNLSRTLVGSSRRKIG